MTIEGPVVRTGAVAPELGARIRLARKQARLSHDRLGALVGTSRQHLIRLEKGMHRPRPEMLARIAEATGKPVEFFEQDDDEEADPVSDLVRSLRALVREVIREQVAA